MRFCRILGLLAWWAAFPAAAGPFYIDSHGRRVELVEAKGFADREETVFSVPGGGRTFSLDRGVIVRLEARIPPAPILKAAGLTLVGDLDREGTLLLCRAKDAKAALAGSVRASALPEVAWALPDFRVPVILAGRPNDPYYPQQWYHQTGSTGGSLFTEDAWDITRGDPQVIVAVIDTGLEPNHPDFAPARILPGFNVLTGGSDVTPEASSLDAHGTCCAGEIAATADNNEGISGVCPACSLLPVLMLRGASQSTEISQGYLSIRYAVEHGAWVLSNSWGIDESVIGTIDVQPFQDAIHEAVTQGRGGLGAVVLFAAGNGDPATGLGRPIGTHELQNLADVMAVGGSGVDDQVVEYSNYGPNLSVLAPTGSKDKSKPAIFTTDTLGSRGFSRDGFFWLPDPYLGKDARTELLEPDTAGNYTAHFTGTSAACPLTAGVVALVFSANPSLTGAQARTVVERTADQVGGVAYDTRGHNDHYGFGRVNAVRAVRAARRGFDQADGAACSEGFNCRGGICGRARSTDPEGLCLTSCEAAGDCPAGRTCAQFSAGVNTCLSVCQGHADCPAGMVCDLEACRPVPCQGDGECPEGASCGADGLCQAPGGGCGCSSTGNGGSWLLVFAGGLCCLGGRFRRRM